MLKYTLSKGYVDPPPGGVHTRNQMSAAALAAIFCTSFVFSLTIALGGWFRTSGTGYAA